MSEAPETSRNPSQQANRKLIRYTNKIKDLVKQLKTRNTKINGYKTKIQELELQNNKLTNELDALASNYKTILLDINTVIDDDSDKPNCFIIKILQKTEQQNEFLRDELVRNTKNDESDINQMIQNALNLDIMVDHLQQENRRLKDRNTYLEVFFEKMAASLYLNKYKKRKYIEFPPNFCDEFGVDFVHCVKAESIRRENEILRNENRTVEEFKRNIYRNMTDHVRNIANKLSGVGKNILELNIEINKRLDKKDKKWKPTRKELMQQKSAMEEAKKGLVEIANLNKQVRSVFIDTSEKKKEASEKNSFDFLNLLERMQKYMAASSAKMSKLESEIEECTKNSEMYHEIVESLKIDFAELEAENEELRKKLELSPIKAD